MRNTKSKQIKAKNLVLIALFAVLIAVCSWISIPTAIPTTMQTFAVFLSLNFLGAKKGIVSICIYLMLGLIGLPVFANFNSGIGALMNITGGYMIGWIFAGGVIWILERWLGRKLWVQAVSMLSGLIVCYLTGTAWFMIIGLQSGNGYQVWTALMWCVLPFLLPDMIKLGLAVWISERLRRILKQG